MLFGRTTSSYLHSNAASGRFVRNHQLLWQVQLEELFRTTSHLPELLLNDQCGRRSLDLGTTDLRVNSRRRLDVRLPSYRFDFKLLFESLTVEVVERVGSS